MVGLRRGRRPPQVEEGGMTKRTSPDTELRMRCLEEAVSLARGRPDPGDAGDDVAAAETFAAFVLGDAKKDRRRG